MKQITQKAVSAFMAGKNFTSGNTSVTTHDGIVKLRLHGNTIAKRELSKPVSHTQVTLCGYNTVTTRERVNGLLQAIGATQFFVQRSYEAHLKDYATQKTRAIDCEDWFYMLGDGKLERGELCDVQD
jgi:hypothetical protein